MRRTAATLGALVFVALLTSQIAAAQFGERGVESTAIRPNDPAADVTACECGPRTPGFVTGANANRTTSAATDGHDGRIVHDETNTLRHSIAAGQSDGPERYRRSDTGSIVRTAPGQRTGTLAATETVQLQVQGGIPDHSDTATVSIVFQYSGKSVTQVRAELFNDPASGAVSYSFVSWRSPTNGTSGDSNAWTAYPGEQYVVEYEVEATSGAQERVYSATAQVRDFSQTYTSTQIRADVTVLEPEFGSIDDTSQSMVLEPEGNRFSESFSFEFDNSGDGRMRVDSIQATAQQSGLEAQVMELPDEVEPDDAGSFTVEISGEKNIAERTYPVEITIEDVVGNTRTYTIQVDIRKPPAVGVPGTYVDVGDVLKSKTSSKTITLEELTGFDDVDGVEVDQTATPYNASMELQGLSSIQISAGGSTDVQADFQIKDRAVKHEQLSWRLYFEPEGEADAVAQRVEIEARVIVEQYFATIEANDVALTFDKPRPTSYDTSIQGTVRNGGHFELDVTGVSATVDWSGISAEVVQSPTSISRHSSRPYEVRITAEDSVPEGEYPVEITFDAAEAESKTITRLVTITHETEMGVSSKTVDFDEITLTSTDTRTISVTENLGYQPIEDVRIDRVSGPEKGWLSVDNPTSVSAGESESVSFTVNFDDKAEVFNEYTWTFEISGEDVETKTVTVTAIYGFPEEAAINQLQNHTSVGGARSAIATPMVDVLKGLEEKARNDEISGTEVSIAFTSGEALDQFLDAIERYNATVESDGQDAAQDELLQAAAAFNIYERYATQLSNPGFKSKSQKSLQRAQKLLDRAIDDQEAYYEQQLQTENPSLLAAANDKRELARIALYRGNVSRATELRTEANRTYDNYAENVSDGIEQRQRADAIYQDLQSSLLVVIAGQPLLPNPMAFDAFQDRSRSIISTYRQAESNFQAAGAQAQADAVRQRRSTVSAELRIARYSVYGFSVLYLVAFLFGVVRMGGNMIAYVRDVREAASGDFLV